MNRLTVLTGFYSLFPTVGSGCEGARLAELHGSVAIGSLSSGRKTGDQLPVSSPNIGERGIFRALAYLAAPLLVAACSGVGGIRPDSPEGEKQRFVAERAEARWHSLIKGDLDSAYQFLSPGTKAAKPLPVYKSQTRPGAWRTAKVQKVACEREICNVTVKVGFAARQIPGLEMDVPETWIIEQGTAWIVLK